MIICETCAVEHPDGAVVCAICADERQWVPADGQQWTSLAELAASGHTAQVRQLEPGLHGVTVRPKVGIGQQAHLVQTPDGNLLWDPPGYLDDDVVQQVAALGPVVAVAASHPHMFGVQVEWARRLGDVPVLVCAPDLRWVARPDPLVRTWSGVHPLLPQVSLHQLGGHFPGSAVAHWPAGADGRGVLLTGDTLQSNPDRASTTFLRSFPNRIPLSPAVVRRIASAVDRFAFDRLYDNLGGTIGQDARGAVRRSADRYVAWVSGEHDDLT
jgi:hypothetical protein